MSFCLLFLIRRVLGQVAGQELAESFGALIAEDLLRRAFLLDPALVQEYGVVGDFAREAESSAAWTELECHMLYS